MFYVDRTYRFCSAEDNKIRRNYCKNASLYKFKHPRTSLLCFNLSISNMYCNLIWCNTCKTWTQKFMDIQKKIVSLMTFLSFWAHTEQNFIDLKILNDTKLNNYLTSLFMFRHHHLNNFTRFFAKFFTTMQ